MARQSPAVGSDDPDPCGPAPPEGLALNRLLADTARFQLALSKAQSAGALGRNEDAVTTRAGDLYKAVPRFHP